MHPDELHEPLPEREVRRRINTLEHCLRVALDELPDGPALRNIRELLFRAGIDPVRL